MSIIGSGTTRCGCRATCTSGAHRRTPGPLGHRQRHQAEQLPPAAPGVQARRTGPAPMSSNHSVPGSRAQLVHRVERVARARALELAAFEHEARARRRSPGFTIASRSPAVADRAGLLPRLAGRNPAHLVQRQRVECAARQRRVRLLRRIEGAAENADARSLARALPGTAPSWPRARPIARPQEVGVQRAPRACPARAASRSASVTSGGIDIRMLSVRPPDCRPNSVPRSQTRLNST